MMNARTRSAPCRLSFIAFTALIVGACGGDDPAGPDPGDEANLPIVWTFDAGLEGWDPSEQCNGNPDCYPVGFVTVADGMVILEGAGEPDFPNASISRAVTLPPGSSTVAIRAVSSCTGTAALGTDIQIRVHANGPSAVLHDWSTVGTSWETVSVDVGGFAGQQVAIYIEQNDNGEQEDFASAPEALCIDQVTVTGAI